jgi:hypothetical protein
MFLEYHGLSQLVSSRPASYAKDRGPYIPQAGVIYTGPLISVGSNLWVQSNADRKYSFKNPESSIKPNLSLSHTEHYMCPYE